MLGQSHGFNSVHGRMPSVLTGANLANRDLIYLGVSGDGDTASIGLGQFAHAMRRGVNMVYIVENNGVYGLTKGQFSATADRGSKSKKGVDATDEPIDLVALRDRSSARPSSRAASPATRRSSCPLIKAAFEHRGAAFIDVISPCVTFNNHDGSTKSFDYVREHNIALNALDFIDGARADRDRLRRGRARGGRAARRLDDPRCTSSTTTTTSRTARRARDAGAPSRRRRDRDRPHLSQRERRQELHDASARRSARSTRLGEAGPLPRLEGAGGDQRVAEVAREHFGLRIHAANDTGVR